MEPANGIPELAEWTDIKDIERQLIGAMDVLVDDDTDHVLARRALARTIASMRAEKSWEQEDILNRRFAYQLSSFHFLGSGVIA
ncbi:MAG TPA: hypothetical protein VKM55_19060 [Candidatus Lokiarchaeia archaeon]|nr:hypothetical protein [Candidatus Lokiarchaeia archaeon]